MSNLTDHLAEQDAITSECDAGRCNHPMCWKPEAFDRLVYDFMVCEAMNTPEDLDTIIGDGSHIETHLAEMMTGHQSLPEDEATDMRSGLRAALIRFVANRPDRAASKPAVAVDDAPVKKVCARCGGTEITVKATAEWDIEYQMWNVHEVIDEAYCYDCGQETVTLDQPTTWGEA
jgi:hypothetical protein